MTQDRKPGDMKTIFQTTISLLTPLHIGSGRELQRGFDFVVRDGKTWVMDADTFLADIFWRDGNADERILGRPASELLQASDFQPDSDYFRYVLPGQPRSAQHGAALVEQLKDAYDRPYLPGTSIKGALRTVMAWHGFQERNIKLNVNDLRGGRGWAGQSVERKIFGKDPNHDLLRALHVADSDSRGTDQLQIINAQVFTGGQKSGAPIELEAVRSDTIFSTTITVDQSLQMDQADQVLRFGAKWKWLEELPQIARAHALQRMQAEAAWYGKRPGYEQVAGFYRQLSSILESGNLASHQFLLQIGWGGGWLSKTIGQPLQADEQEWERLLNQKRLSPARMSRRRGDAFPKSRRAVAVRDRPVAPFGWCLVEMKEI